MRIKAESVLSLVFPLSNREPGKKVMNFREPGAEDKGQRSAGENYSQMYALLRSGEISQGAFDEFDKRHYGVENKLINLAKSLSKKKKTGQDWNSDYKTE